jgi:hypothetical protein
MMTINTMLTRVAINAAIAAICGMKGPPAISWNTINDTPKNIHCDILL